MKGCKPSLGCITIPLILQIITLVVQSPFLFVSSSTGKTIRGFRAEDIRNDGLSQRKLPDAKEDKQKDTRKNDTKAEKNKDTRNGVEKIETSQPGSANIEEDSGRDDVESPNGTSDSLWSLEKSTDLSTAASETLDPTSDPSEFDNIFEASSGDLNSDISDGYFDSVRFVAREKLEPITFNMTVSEFRYTLDYNKVESYLKDFVEDVLNMRSNRGWYPSHSKSMHNISIELFPSVVVEDQEVESADQTIPVQLTVNGLVLVHAKNQDTGAVASKTRNRGGKKQQQSEINDSASLSPFHDSFDHSMFLYFTFWGVDDLQQILEQDGGLQNPVIDSVSSGNKRLITFNTDKDDNYVFRGDHHSEKPKKVIPRAEIESSAKTTKIGLSSFSIIVVAGALL